MYAIRSYYADTGGQIKYVIELANALSQREEVRQVELFTRLISDKAVSKDYAKSLEKVNDKFKIVRIQCGGRKYMRKELRITSYNVCYTKLLRSDYKIMQSVQGPAFGNSGYQNAGWGFASNVRFDDIKLYDTKRNNFV